jgi:hypothetical protein
MNHRLARYTNLLECCAKAIRGKYIIYCNGKKKMLVEQEVPDALSTKAERLLLKPPCLLDPLCDLKLQIANLGGNAPLSSRPYL